MTEFTPRDPNFAPRVTDSFAKQGLMKTFGAYLGGIRPGFVEVMLPYNEKLTQQHGFIHAGAISAIVDGAGGYAASTLYDAGDGVLTVEFKINLMAPAKGDMIIARGQVVRPGRTLTTTTGEVFAIQDGEEIPCAIMQQTIMRIVGHADVND